MPGYSKVRFEPLLKERDAMLGQVPGDSDKKVVEIIAVGDLSMRANDKASGYQNKSTRFQTVYRPPKCRLTTPWYAVEHHRLRVDLTIIGPKAKEIQRDLPLAGGKAERILEKIADLVKSLEEELR